MHMNISIPTPDKRKFPSHGIIPSSLAFCSSRILWISIFTLLAFQIRPYWKHMQTNSFCPMKREDLTSNLSAALH
jgi:hypothetical protein